MSFTSGNVSNFGAASTAVSENPEYAFSMVSVDEEPRKLFVGEVLIVGSSLHYHTDILAIDALGETIRVGFMFPEAARLPRDIIISGCTIMILTPEATQMRGGGEGLEVDDSHLIKVLPHRIQYLTELHEKLQLFTSVENGKRICYGCRRRRAVVHQCTRCKVFYFCNKNCHQAANVDELHRADCRFLRDMDMALLIRGMWDELSEFRSVSLRRSSGLVAGFFIG
ncbi:hypothetical protein BJX70DRAFT_396128 [Aspergillus crustosus]